MSPCKTLGLITKNTFVHLCSCTSNQSQQKPLLQLQTKTSELPSCAGRHMQAFVQKPQPSEQKYLLVYLRDNPIQADQSCVILSEQGIFSGKSHVVDDASQSHHFSTFTWPSQLVRKASLPSCFPESLLPRLGFVSASQCCGCLSGNRTLLILECPSCRSCVVADTLSFELKF